MKIEDLSAAAVITIKSFDHTASLPSDFFATADSCQQSQEELLDGFKLHRSLLRRRNVRKEQKLQEHQARERQQDEQTQRLEDVRNVSSFTSSENHNTTWDQLDASSHTKRRPVTSSSSSSSSSKKAFQAHLAMHDKISLGQYHLPVSPSPPKMTSPPMTLDRENVTTPDCLYHGPGYCQSCKNPWGKRSMNVPTSPLCSSRRPSKARRLHL